MNTENDAGVCYGGTIFDYPVIVAPGTHLTISGNDGLQVRSTAIEVPVDPTHAWRDGYVAGFGTMVIIAIVSYAVWETFFKKY